MQEVTNLNKFILHSQLKYLTGIYEDIANELKNLILNTFNIKGIPRDQLPINCINYYQEDITDQQNPLCYPLNEIQLNEIYIFITKKRVGLSLDINQIRDKNNMLIFKGLQEALNSSVIQLKKKLGNEKLLSRTPALYILFQIINTSELLSNSILVNVIQKTLGELVLKANPYNQEEKQMFNFSCFYITLSTNLGSNMFHRLTAGLKHNYYNIINMHLNLDESKFKEYLQLLELKKNKTKINLKSPKITECIINHLNNLYNQKILNKLFFDLENKLIDNLTAFHIILNQVLFDLEKTKQKFLISQKFQELLIEISKIRVEIGGQLISQMILNNILILKEERKFKECHIISICDQFKEELILSLSHQKPFLYQTQQKKIHKNFDNFYLNNTDIHEGHAYAINLKKKLKKINKSPKYIVKIEFFHSFLEYLNSILHLWDKKDYNQDLQMFLEMIYDIDLNSLLEKKNQDQEDEDEEDFFVAIMETCFNFRQSYDSLRVLEYENLLIDVNARYKIYLKEYQCRGFYNEKKKKQ